MQLLGSVGAASSRDKSRQACTEPAVVMALLRWFIRIAIIQIWYQNLKLNGKVNREDRARSWLAWDLNVSSMRPDDGIDKA